ncbi:hypothetical protein NM208_g56 [Fusarium decemcellulare]|uniref:Uncharacterized protein n=1 Tax=Fusarium decemcellulare TaxID=57161 RepID=A0ACC1T0L6_9HYPO|nr:hypothetical protein NM208_g56 [Fusarium decemcellulare]
MTMMGVVILFALLLFLLLVPLILPVGHGILQLVTGKGTSHGANDGARRAVSCLAAKLVPSKCSSSTAGESTHHATLAIWTVGTTWAVLVAILTRVALIGWPGAILGSWSRSSSCLPSQGETVDNLPAGVPRAGGLVGEVLPDNLPVGSLPADGLPEGNLLAGCRPVGNPAGNPAVGRNCGKSWLLLDDLDDVD